MTRSKLGILLAALSAAHAFVQQSYATPRSNLSSVSRAGSGYTKRVIANPKLDFVVNRVASSHGSYTATAPINNASYILQVAPFRGSPNLTPALAPAPTPGGTACSVQGGT